ncbi:MAG: sensor histidine kinase [Acidimicrobiia bacterium]
MPDLSWDVVSSAQEVLSVLPETIVQVDHDFRVITVNRLDSRIFVTPPSPGAFLDELVPGPTLQVIERLVVAARETGIAEADYDTVEERFRLTAKRLETVPMFLLVFQNVTGLRRAEEAVEEVVRDRSSFLASVSHELRTPLTAVVGYANLLSEPHPNLDEDARNCMVQDMTDQAWDLAGIVEDLLAVARTEIGELTVVSVPVNLRANIAQVIEAMGRRGDQVTVSGDRSIMGLGDPARFRQIVRNLLSNALTHGEEPVTVEVVADDTFAAVQVRDSGPGVHEALAESIFDQYTSGDTYTPGRVGIGLWICRELASQMGGHLTYRREPGETVFQATLPALVR